MDVSMESDYIVNSEKDFEKLWNRINDFTTLFNKYGFEYSVSSWDSGEGNSITFNNGIRIDFYLSGLVEFDDDDDKDDDKDDDNDDKEKKDKI